MTILSKIFYYLKTYLTDWKNLLVHGLVGVLLLLIAILAPVDIIWKIIIFLCVIIFNIIRMKYFKKEN